MVVPRASRQNIAVALALDVVLTLVFVLIGRSNHAEAFDVFGILTTWWPFLVGLLVGWLITRAWRSPRAVIWQGIGIWLATVIVGMVLRVVSGQGTATSFVIVATVALGILLIGWRLLAKLLPRRRAIGS